MAYTKTAWKDNETKLSAENLNKIEDGLEAAAKKADDLAAAISYTQSSLNENLTRIDPILDDHGKELETVADTLEDHEKRISNNSSDISTLQLDVVTLDQDIDAVEGDIEDINTIKIPELEADLAGVGSGLSSVNDGLAQHLVDTNNPHSVIAQQVGAYDKAEVDNKTTPAAVFSGTLGAGGGAGLSCEDMTPEDTEIYVKLQAKSIFDSSEKSDYLWSHHSAGIDISGTIYGDNFYTPGYNLEPPIGYDTAGGRARLVPLRPEDESVCTDIADNYEQDSLTYFYGHFFGLKQGYISSQTGSLNIADLVLLFFSPSDPTKYFLICPGSLFYDGYGAGIDTLHCSFNIDSDGRLCIEYINDYFGHYDKYMFTDLPKDLVLAHIGLRGEMTVSANLEYFIYDCTQLHTNLSVTDLKTLGSTSHTLYTSGEHFIKVPAVSKGYCSIGLHAPGSGTIGDIDYEIRYLRDTNFVDASKILASKVRPEDVAAELAKLISYGTSDPDGTTPGILYFKYLE